MKIINLQSVSLLTALTLGSLSSVGFSQTIEIGGDFDLIYKGSIGIESWAYPQEAIHKSHKDFKNTVVSDLDLTLQTPYDLNMKMKPRLILDVDDVDTDQFETADLRMYGQSRSRLYFEDLFVDYFAERFELRAGLQTFSWKTVESLSWADVLNQSDAQVDFFDAPKFGDLATRLRLVMTEEEDQYLELYYLPYFSPTHYPTTGSRSDLFSLTPTYVSNDRDKVTYGSEDEQLRTQYAIRYTFGLFESIDASAFFFHGYDRSPILKPGNPIFSQDISGNPEIVGAEMVQHYEPAYMGGFTFTGEIDSWLIKGEGLYHQYEKDSIILKQTRPYFAYTLGTEYTLFEPIVDNQDLGIIVEAIGTTDAGIDLDELLNFKPFNNHLFGGLRYTFNNISDRSILLGAFSSYLDYEIVGQLTYEERLFELFKVKLGGQLLSGNKKSPLRQFESSSRAESSLMWNF